MIRKTLLVAGLMLASCGGSSDSCTTMWNSLARFNKEIDVCEQTSLPADYDQEVSADIQTCQQAEATCTAADKDAIGKLANCIAGLPDVVCTWTQDQATAWQNQFVACTNVILTADCSVSVPSVGGN